MTQERLSRVAAVLTEEVNATKGPVALLQGFDTIYFSLDEEVSASIWEKLQAEQDTAKLLAKGRQKEAHCPENWQTARKKTLQVQNFI